MPVGATIGAAVVGAGAGIYSSSQASKAQTNAANTASSGELAAAQANNALTASIYNSNAARLDPYSALGLPAGGEYNALLGIAAPAAADPSTAPPPALPINANGTTGTGYGGPSLAQIQGMQHDGIPGNYRAAMANYGAQATAPSSPALSMPNYSPSNALAAVSGTGTASQVTPIRAAATVPTGDGTPTTAVAGANGPTNALAGFQTFYNSPAYQVPLAAGLKGVNTKYGAAGALESGAAMKGISDYAAGNAAGALGDYLNNLYRQEALGESASSALAGVGQNMVSQVSANNNNAASAAGNAALVAGQGSANNWNAVGAGINQAAGTIAGAMGSSYHPSNALAYNMAQPVPVNIPTAQPYSYIPGGL